MSYILEALKKSEEQREQVKVPNLASRHGMDVSDSKPVPNWMIGAGGAGAVAVVGLAGWFIFGGTAEPTVTAQAPAIEAPVNPSSDMAKPVPAPAIVKALPTSALAPDPAPAPDPASTPAPKTAPVVEPVQIAPPPVPVAPQVAAEETAEPVLPLQQPFVAATPAPVKQAPPVVVAKADPASIKKVSPPVIAKAEPTPAPAPKPEAKAAPKPVDPPKKAVVPPAMKIVKAPAPEVVANVTSKPKPKPKSKATPKPKPGLPALYDAQSYSKRGWSLVGKGLYGQAVRDFGAALKMEPAYADAYFGRGWAEEKSGRTDVAIADYGRAVDWRPEYLDAYFSRGVLYLNKGSRQAAARDFKVYFDRSEESLRRYGLLWLYVAQARAEQSNASANLKANAKSMNLAPWPGILGSMFLGDATPQEALAQAKDTNAKRQREKHCVAWYFIGQYHLIKGSRDAARIAFAKAVETGVAEYRQYGAAKAELKRF